MDWERTKTVFILAFLLLNAVFVFQLWLVPNYFDSSMYISSQHIDEKLADLQYKNITVAAEIPRRLQHLRMLILRNPGVNKRNVAEELLGNDVVQVPVPPNSGSQSRRFLSDLGEVLIYNDGRILYTSKLETGGQELTESAAWEIAADFLTRTVGKPKDAVPGRIAQTEDGWLIEYNQRWRRKEVAASRISILVDETGVLRMEYYWVDVLGYTGEKIITIPATGALTVIMESMAPGSVITKIYNSWYSTPVLAEQWRSYPVWVIETEEGSRYYINAFTGDLEGSEDFPAGKPGSTLN